MFALPYMSDLPIPTFGTMGKIIFEFFFEGFSYYCVQPGLAANNNKPIQDGGEAKAPLWLNRLSVTD